MNGHIDSGGRALISIELQSATESASTALDVWIDTGFTGDLVIPQSIIGALSLSQSGSVDAVLADGSQTQLNTYTCVLDWFGSVRKLEVIANSGEYPLLGVGLLLGLELRVDYLNQKLSLTPAAPEPA